MTTQQTDVEKTLKRILARELPAWPEGAVVAYQSRVDSEIYFDDPYGDGINNCYLRSGISAVDPLSGVSRADWEAERALLALEQAQPLGDSEEFDQALWDRVAVNAYHAFLTRSGTESYAILEGKSKGACDAADAFMAERAKRIAARKASHE